MRQLGIPEFRSWQEAPFEAILSGRDIFVMVSTAGGKSLLYQLAALIGEGLTLVISPHRALQADQVVYLRSKGIAATFLNSDQSKSERGAILADLPHIQLLYLAPEQLDKDDLLEALSGCWVARVAVDEAHVLPQVKDGFRKAYGKIGTFIASLPRHPQIIACTATAAPKTRRQILESLGVPNADVFCTPVRRDNLSLEVKRVEDQNVLYCSVESALNKWKQAKKKDRGSVIIYCPTVAGVKRMHNWLKARGWNVQKYTGKMLQGKRKEAMERFMSGESPIMIATNAFGLGVNKPDVRLVLHAGMPLSMSGYVQEVGRAGRDGKAAKCLLFYTRGDYGRNKGILTHGVSQESARQAVNDLDALARMLKSDKCLWRQIEHYLGEKPGKDCRECCRCRFKGV